MLYGHQKLDILTSKQNHQSLSPLPKSSHLQSKSFAMFFSGFLPLSILALLPIAFAAPAPAPTPDTVQVASSVAAIDWIPVDFEGKTLYVNSAAIVGTSVNLAKKVVRVLRRSTTDRCGGSTFNPLSAPPAYVSDCRVIQDCRF